MEFVALVGFAFAVAVLLIWRGRRTGTDDVTGIPLAKGDQPNREDAEFEAARGRAPAGRR
jgi:hypothetical protein